MLDRSTGSPPRLAAALALVVIAVAFGAPQPARADDDAVAVVGLETDGATELLGTDDPTPRFSWRLAAERRGVLQAAYQVLVASSPERLRPGRADLWDSGRVAAATVPTRAAGAGAAGLAAVRGPRGAVGRVRSSAPWADYAGRPLASRTRYYWTARVWDERGRATPFAPPAWFETAFLSPDGWRAQWIAGPARPRLAGPDALVSPDQVATAGEACRPVGAPGPLSLASEPRADAYRARWQGACRAVRPAPLLRRAFTVEGEVVRARLYVGGAGYADAYVNGEQLGDGAVLDPGYTDYARRTLYVTYDVTDRLRAGENALGFELGSGFYDYDVPGEWRWTEADWRGDPRVRAELHAELAGGGRLVVVTDGSWKTVEVPTRYDNANIGETYDARFAQPGWTEPGFDDRAWRPARVVSGPGGVASAQTHEPIAIVGRRDPVAVREPRTGIVVYDFGAQGTGWVELTLDAPRGAAAEIRYGEALKEDGTVDLTRNLHVADQLQTDLLVSDGAGPVRWRPRFSYKGFRYVQVSGPRETPLAGAVSGVRGDVVRSAVRSTARFASDHELLNGIFAAVERTIASNLHGIVTDTPVYEKNGWTGDAQLTAPTAAMLFDLRRFYAKWVRDLRDAQLASGELPVIVPSGGAYGYTGVAWESAWGATPAWDAALFVLPSEVHARYGDARVLAATYGAMRRWVDAWLPLWSDGHVVRSDLGDWLSPVGMVLPRLVPTAYATELVRMLASTADLLGRPGDRARYRRRHAEMRAAFEASFWDATSGTYRETPGDPFAQTADLLPLAFALAPPGRRAALVDALAADVAARGGNLATGVVGTRHLLKELTAAGRIDVAFGIATQTDRPSWGEWLALGHTSLLEAWGPAVRSQNHHMFGSVGQWMLEDLAGIEPLEPGYGTIELRPELPTSGLDAVSASLDTVRGEVAVAWRRDASEVVLEVVVPPGATGIVHVPATEPGAVTAETDDVRLLGASGGRVLYRVGSGSYRFVVPRGDPG